MKCIEAWIIGRAFHEDYPVAEVLRAYVRAGISKTPKAWDARLQLTAGKVAGFGGDADSIRPSARSRAAELVQLGWLERSGARGNSQIRLTDLGEQVINALSGPQPQFEQLTRFSRLNLKCVARSEDLRGRVVFPSLTALYVLRQLEGIAGAKDAYLTEDDLRYFLMWTWDDPQTAEGRRALNAVARAIHKAHQKGKYPNPKVLPKHDHDAPRHFVANFIRTGLFRLDDDKRLWLVPEEVADTMGKKVQDWRSAWAAVRDKARGVGKPKKPKAKPQRLSVVFDEDYQAVDLTEPPKRKAGTISRIVRNTAVIKQLKELYDHRCQVCGATIPVADGQPYSEGHHLKPLGSPHNGVDSPANVLILCPNHHAMFDLGTLAIDPADGRTLLYIDSKAKEHGRKLRVRHHIAGANIVHHYERIWRGSKK